MKTNNLNIISAIAAISLFGILITQALWLRKTSSNAEKNFNHRADQMLAEVVDELQTFADTSRSIQKQIETGKLCFYDVVDTNLLDQLLHKYVEYHNLDTLFNYALIETGTDNILYRSKSFILENERMASKVCLSCIWKKEYIHLSVYFPHKYKFVRSSLIGWMLLSLIFSLATFGAVIFIIISIYKQKKIAEIKNDFVNNMTHELKTPLSTISVASEVLMKTSSAENKTIGKYSKIIFDENSRMRKLVDKVLNIATLDKGMQVVDLSETDLHSTICKTVSNFCFEACSKDVKVNYELNAINPIIDADVLHLRNVLNNIVDNAIKYASKEPSLTIATETVPEFIKISVIDNGKGIPKEALKRIFEKFYRVPSGNIHNVKGFGLGLFYVKSIVEAHNGKVEVHSTVNKGTTVVIYLPQANNIEPTI